MHILPRSRFVSTTLPVFVSQIENREEAKCHKYAVFVPNTIYVLFFYSKIVVVILGRLICTQNLFYSNLIFFRSKFVEFGFQNKAFQFFFLDDPFTVFLEYPFYTFLNDPFTVLSKHRKGRNCSGQDGRFTAQFTQKFEGSGLA